MATDFRSGGNRWVCRCVADDPDPAVTITDSAGCTFEDVVDVTLFVVDPESNLDAIWSILPEYWGEAPYPTLTGIGVTWLYGFKFEIKVIARLP